MESLVTLAEKFGVMFAMVAFFIWWAYQRERRLADKLDKVDAYQRGQLQSMVERSTEALVQTKDALHETSDGLKEGYQVMRDTRKTLEKTNFLLESFNGGPKVGGI